ncbi:MAG: hypothetical protein F6K09_02760 [Merismopedia sp. SIO2A8]|nr:hypothetical protein [Symploca sp. SIO2B6]NET47648.1 hypothetical protein [Merismopedia sp. SIO2A8]
MRSLKLMVMCYLIISASGCSTPLNSSPSSTSDTTIKPDQYTETNAQPALEPASTGNTTTQPLATNSQSNSTSASPEDEAAATTRQGVKSLW